MSAAKTTQLQGKIICLTGAGGMLAGDLIPQIEHAGGTLLLSDRSARERFGHEIDALDITNPAAVEAYFKKRRPQWIVNCAAYTQVDDAEKEKDLAFEINAMGPANLARAAADIGSKLLHISTDYVFGGSLYAERPRSPFSEDELLSPCGVYGHSKRFGEELLRSILPERSLIVRTSWLHGVHGPNFVDTMLRVGREKGELKVVNDQFGSPTWTNWLSEVLVDLLRLDALGIFHASSRGNISWHDFAAEIFRQSELSVKLGTQTTEELNRPAPRPAYSTLDVQNLERFRGKPCIDWKDCVKGHLAERLAANS